MLSTTDAKNMVASTLDMILIQPYKFSWLRTHFLLANTEIMSGCACIFD